MAKYEVGERIIFRRPEDDGKIRGRITQFPGKEGRYSVVTDSKKRVKVHWKHVSGESPDRVLILEGRLDRNLRSKRSYGPTFQKLLYPYGVEALYEKMHTKDGLRAFLEREGKKPEYRVIHLMSHGKQSKRGHKAILELTHDKVDIEDSYEIFEGLEGKILIFSACVIGSNKKVMTKLKEISGAAAIVVYTHEVNDYYTNLAEHLFYHQLFENELSPQKSIEVVRDLLMWGKVGLSGKIIRAPVIKCY